MSRHPFQFQGRQANLVVPFQANRAPLRSGAVVELGAGRLNDRERALLFKKLATMLDAGLPLARALRTAATGVGSRRGPLSDMVAGLEAGVALHEVVRRHASLFLPLEVAMIRAGELSGTLPALLAELSRHCDVRIQERRRLWSELSQPLISLHALFLIPPFPQFFLGQISLLTYCLQAVAPLAAGYALVALAWWRSTHGSRTQESRLRVDSLLLAVPLLGRALVQLAVSRWAKAFRALYVAGVELGEAMPLAGAASGNAVIEAASVRAAQRIVRGEPIAAALAATGKFPDDAISLLETGEEAGRLDDILDKLATTYEEQARWTLAILRRVFSFVVYLVVVFFIARHIIGYYMGHVANIRKVMEP